MGYLVMSVMEDIDEVDIKVFGGEVMRELEGRLIREEGRGWKYNIVSEKVNKIIG